MNPNSQIEKLVTAVTASSKYKYISPELVREIGERALTTRPSLKTAIKATKNKLHQVGGAYFPQGTGYERATEKLWETANDPVQFRATCREIMQRHASTKERLPILDTFFTTTLANLPPIQSVIDIACGLNPLAWPWMPWNNQVMYIAYDIYADAIAFIQQFMEIAGVNGRAEVRDVLHNPPTQPVDLVLILKSLPCLEQLDNAASHILLDAVQARYLLISYPAASLGGRNKGMRENYATHFAALVGKRPWRVQRFDFETEIAFLVETTYAEIQYLLKNLG